MGPRVIQNGGTVAAASARRGAAGQQQGDGNSRKARTLPHGCVSPSADADVGRRGATKISRSSRPASKSSPLDRKSAEEGTSVSVRLDIGGRRLHKKKKRD